MSVPYTKMHRGFAIFPRHFIPAHNHERCSMPILNEILVSVVGGVATALILGVLVRPAPERATRSGRARGGRSLIGDLVHLILAVAGGIAFALLFGRYAFQSGLMDKSLGARLLLLVGGTAISWLVLLPLRRR